MLPETGFTFWWALTQKTQAKRLNQAKEFEKEEFYLQQVMESPGDFFQSSIPEQNGGSFTVRVYTYL